MTRKGLDQTQQHQVKQLIFECSLAKMSSFRTQQVLKEKLDVDVTIGWINEIKAQFKEDARKEYYRLLTDNFAYKHLTMQVMQQLHEIIKQQWDIVNNHKGKNDLIALNALSEVKESVLRVSEFYKYLPEVETNLFNLRRNREYNDNYISISGSGGNSSNSKIEDLDNIDIDKEPSLTEVEKEQLRNGLSLLLVEIPRLVS
jgi:hypothetical protein